jgi:hypothetical protein
MIKRRTLASLILLAFAALSQAAAPASADGHVPAPIVIKGTYGFDWHKPAKSKCVKVSGALLRKLQKSYTCATVDKQTASGKPAVAACTNAGKTSEYLLFSSAADCKAERDTQLANGD